MDENEISAVVLDAAIAVHNELGGPGLLESYYENALKREPNCRLGIVINFGQDRIINGWQRVANHMPQ